MIAVRVTSRSNNAWKKQINLVQLVVTVASISR